MADNFPNFAALLASSYVEGVDWTRTTYPVAGATWCSIAIHGGGIEAGSGEMARAVGAGLMNTYEFAGLLPSGNFDQLHITSTNFDDPTCLAVVNPSRRTLSFHGYAGVDGLAETAIGGLDTVMVARVGAALRAAGFRVVTAPSEIAGTDPANICNKNAIGAGVQLEMSRALRQSFFPNGDTSRAMRDSGQRTDTFLRYAAAVRSAYMGRGRISVGAINSSRWASLPGQYADGTASATVSTDKLAAGGSHFFAVAGRMSDTTGTNCYLARLDMNTSGQVVVTARKRVGGTETLLSQFTTTLTHTPGGRLGVELDVRGPAVRARAWAVGGVKPDWQVSANDTSITAPGRWGLRAILSSANTNTLPVVYDVDDFVLMADDPDATDTLTLASQDGFWLRSPLHPSKDRRLWLRPDGSCPPNGGVFFAGMDATEEYASNASSAAPANRRLSTYVSRPRRGWEGALNLVTRTFADRDAVLDTLGDGTALQFAAPPEYGIPPRYLGAGDVSVRRGLPDHRAQPRLISMPCVQVEQPAGPATGPAGARNRDLCDDYATWDEVVAAGVTYDDLIRVS